MDVDQFIQEHTAPLADNFIEQQNFSIFNLYDFLKTLTIIQASAWYLKMGFYPKTPQTCQICANLMKLYKVKINIRSKDLVGGVLAAKYGSSLLQEGFSQEHISN